MEKNTNSLSARRAMLRRITVVGILSAVATILMFMSFSVPFMPSFIKLDISELPALLAAFAFGPVEGVLVCFLKNLVNVFFSTTGGVGELSNFLLGCAFVVPAGLIYKFGKNRRAALIGSMIGALVMALMSLPLNYYVMYPIYSNFLPIEQIIAAYQAIVPGVDGLLTCLILFNIPFTFFKGCIDVAITFLIYKRISGVMHGKRR